MTANKWNWFVPETDENVVSQLTQALNIHPLVAAILYQRGLHSPEAAKRFIECNLSDLGDPFTMTGAAAAAGRLAKAVEQQEKVLIFGDYDVDGVTATALLVHVLESLRVPVEYYIPSRLTEGYGLQGNILSKFAREGGRLAITVDCGINSFAEMELASSLGLDLIVTDHHTCFAGERAALAVLNPKQAECTYPEKQLAGVGVAWTLVRALYSLLNLPQEQAYQYLDLVAVGTITDVVPLLGENRILVKHGLARLRDNPSPGLAALARAAGLQNTDLTVTQVAFMLAPRLNAAGRMAEAELAVRTLLATETEADILAQCLDAQNRQRQQLEKKIAAEAREMAAAQQQEPALVLWREGWHPGVIGIVAGRLASEFKRPVVMIGVEDGEGRGSIRSVSGYNVVEALQACAEYLESYGGHTEAAGLTLAEENLTAFRRAFCQAIAAQEPEEPLRPVAAEVSLAELDLKLVNELQLLAPFGYGNEEPCFLVNGVEIFGTRQVGSDGAHLRLSLKQGTTMQQAIFFGAGKYNLQRGDSADFVLIPTANQWRDKTYLSLQIIDFRPALPQKFPKIIDWRGVGNREKMLAQIAAGKKIIVWVNTKAARDGLKKILPPTAVITQLGRAVDITQSYDALIFYHLPYERRAVEKLWQALISRHYPLVYLCYGAKEKELNEKIFAATLPSAETLLQLAACLPQSGKGLGQQQLQQQLMQPVTQYLFKQMQAVFAEVAAAGSTAWPPAAKLLHKSPTFCRHQRILQEFRFYQNFWYTAATAELENYLLKPETLVLREEES
ncbi:MAG: single-stranded-DNA-specific exonuclease RecJ [Firmicutes bacterium]|nr:single-stranded-DNA-specific exonuclease RecJ [Bacillota bacterium]